MRSDRPAALAVLLRDRMQQAPGSPAGRAKAARNVLAQAHAFHRAADTNIAEGLALPAVSALHEAARLAVTAVAALNGYRFSNVAAHHEAVVDYAFAIELVDRKRHAQLDQLRELRHQVNYPEDLIVPSEREIEQYRALVAAVVAVAASKFPAKRIPPPPGRN